MVNFLQPVDDHPCFSVAAFVTWRQQDQVQRRQLWPETSELRSCCDLEDTN